jgi:ABC-type multidrug transport system ATPase subunit
MNAAGAEPLLSVEAVTKDFAAAWRGRPRRALDGVSLRVARGEICALIGPNGSGKSTLLKLAAGLLRPTGGSCRRRAARIGYLPEQLALPAGETASAWLTALARIQGGAAAAAADEAQRALARVGLGGAVSRPLGGLSRGMRQRVALAQALLGAPELLLLDEPAAGLDPHGVEMLARVLREESARGAGVVVTTHFLPRLEQDCDCCVLLVEGRVRFEGAGRELAARGGAERVYLAELPA